ncbi:HPP family protein [Desulfosporosinus youngiae]|uniref:CBS-domain-containing membrane protein n=1 Tax=Desulfosporosinus youngiae DSM 17734 TaxID=768710 RepID=H5XWT9_9FIRM|nr:HPP family protein [Desulfosporosinus youngiae]EHQ90738.1 CBS-domain-containing membrane protein [Desulfosporosinus youngiae DSM 17734]
MPKKLNSVQIRVRSICRREFERDVYRPGVISLSRLVWGSLGSCLVLAAISLLSKAAGIAVLFPPLAATCFINSSCVYLRVARPKPVIVGHFVSSIGGLAGVWTGELLAGDTDFVIPLKLSLTLLYAAVLMQVFDADHPPAAATAVIPAVLPLPMPAWLFPLYMAWGATLTVLFALVWNRIWLEFPAKDDDHRVKYAGLYMTRAQVWGMALCLLSMVLMSCKHIVPALYFLGLGGMTLGVLLLGTHHFVEALITRKAGNH